MATNYFLHIKDIPGECSDAAHKEWIEVIEFSHDLRQEAGATRAATGGLTTGRATHSSFRIVKFVDKSSPKLAEACSGGNHIGDIIIELNKMKNGKQCPFMEYKLTNACITSWRPGAELKSRLREDGRSYEDSSAHESVEFGYNKIEWKYNEHDEKGTKKGSVSSSWDLVANQV